MLDSREWSYTAKPESEQVRLEGRSDLLSLVRTARITLDAADLVPGKDKVVKEPVPVDEKSKGIDKLSVQPVTVILTWRELPPGKPFRVQPVTKGTLPAGFTARSATAQPATILVRASTLNGKLPDTAVIETEPIDLTNHKSSFTATVRVVPPAGTTVSVEQVNVTVTIQEATQDRVFKGVPLTVQGRAAPAGEAALAVTDVQVTVHGPYSLVTALEPSQITAYVDVEGLSTGKHQLPVKILMAPTGLTADADPAVVEVNIVTP
jgi:YbbR domain-containing protein